MSTDLLDRPKHLGTSGYGVFAGEEDDDTDSGRGPAASSGGPSVSLREPNAALHRKSSHRSSFFGRLGTKRTEAEPEAALSKMQTGKAPLLLRQLRVQLSYDEDAFPAGLELDMFALLYDKDAKYLDCIFYRNTEDAAGAFSLNVATHSMAIDLTRVPEECGVIILAAAVYTLGISLPEIEAGKISLSGGFMGPTLKEIALGSLKAPSDASSASGLIYFGVGEKDGAWYYKEPVIFTRAGLDSLMSPSKDLAQEMNTEMQHPEAFGLPTLDSLISDARDNRMRRLSQSSEDSREGDPFRTSSALRQSLDRANSLRQRIADIKSSLQSREDFGAIMERKNSAVALVSKRVEDCERRQTELEVTLHQLRSKVDYLYAYLGVEELHTSPPR